ncbi:NifB/NifX family molybdenum-iron cluster-binding protein [Sedimentibacter hydroxybenzoicus DSM 7310]|uniref:NifB/NifX family molybdenum-iron cluster-binding protein n=1 Tax=Sedimentibacter hydroxybenzoicus DSM 7310 TaxID=1123245 RepID=A0A974GXU9_SEDHY|nr:NifB/NifX family molybdenum-iron cluster-binding protein [Sedimentibacter hydroxybenzoicus]NYB75999.1 NifB/NifX family molybdenum-iron cluster-binding protein [Sedimentibacter hydroxybenzoicus DSM 7310]
MKIALPAGEKNMNSDVYESYGRSPYIFMYNSVTKESEFLDNSAVLNQGAAGIRVSQVVADNGVKVLIAPRCGENAQKILNNAEVLIYQSVPGTLQHNINEYFSDNLKLLNDFHPGFHGK